MLHADLQELLSYGSARSELELISKRRVETSFAGQYASCFKGSGLDFDEVREYVHGDDIRTIDWRVTARTSKPHIKLFREERERNVFVVVDHGAHLLFGTRKTFKNVQAARAAALLSFAALQHHDRLGMAIFGGLKKKWQFLPPTRTRKSLWQGLKILSAVPEDRVPPFQISDMLTQLFGRCRRGSLVFIVADFIYHLEGLEDALKRFSEYREVVLLHLTDSGDNMLPAMGNITFFDGYGKKIDINTDSAKGREQFTKEVNAKRNQLNQLVDKYRLPLIEISTTDDVPTSLLQSLKALAENKRRM